MVMVMFEGLDVIDIILSQMASPLPFLPSPSNSHSKIFDQLCEHGNVSQLRDFMNVNIIECSKIFINFGMHKAYDNGNVDVIKYLISLGGDVSYLHSWNSTLPNVLINRENHIQLAGFVIDRQYKFSESTLYHLCLDGKCNSSIMSKLNDNNGQLKRHEVFDLCLWFAFVGGCQETIFFILDLIREHLTLIKREFYQNDYDTLLIIERIYGQNKLFHLNIPTVYGYRNLFYWACKNGHLEAVQQCVTMFLNGKHYCTGSGFGDGIYVVCENNHPKVLRLLLESRHRKDISIEYAIHVACQKNHADIITILLEYFHSANDYVEYFIGAIQGGHVDLIQKFIHLGVDHFQKGLECACKHQQYHLIDFFLNQGIIDDFNKSFKTLCEEGQVELAKSFINHPTVSLIEGLIAGISRGQENIVRMIIDQETKHATMSRHDWISVLFEACNKRYFFTTSTIMRLIEQYINDTFPDEQISVDTYSSCLSKFCDEYPWFWDSSAIDLVVYFLQKGAQHRFDKFALIPPLLNRGISVETICICFPNSKPNIKNSHLREQSITRHEYLDQTFVQRQKIQRCVSMTLSFVICRDLINIIILPGVSFLSPRLIIM